MKSKIFKSDKFKTARGGYSRLLEIACAKCSEVICLYQKDGPGMLKRMYLDRISGSKKYTGLQHESLKQLPTLNCAGCKELLGVPIVYKKEQRLAFRLFAGSVSKKIVNSK